MSNRIDIDKSSREGKKKLSLGTILMTIVPLFIVVPFTVLGFFVSAGESLLPKYPNLPFFLVYLIPVVVLIVGVIALIHVFKKRRVALLFVLAMGLLFLAFLQVFYGGSAWLIGAVVTVLMVFPLISSWKNGR